MYRKIIEKSMFFYISVAGGGGAKLILRIAYVVRSLYFNFQPIRTIFTMFSPRTAKTTHLSSPPYEVMYKDFIKRINIHAIF